MRITSWKNGLSREPLVHPFGFKGGYISELWQSVVLLSDENGYDGLGNGVQSVLWSDANVFARFRENGGNAMMLALTTYALDLSTQIEWSTPLDLQEQLLPQVTAYARRICDNPHLRLTFVLNSLVPIDTAAWRLYAAAKNITKFEYLIPDEYRAAMGFQHHRLAAVPLITYALTPGHAVTEVEAGCPMLKIKIGADPNGDGDREKMLKWDCQRLSDLHNELKRFQTTETTNGRIAYYLDANGRYDSKDRLLRFLDHADKIDALAQIVLLEEPFSEDSNIEVGDLPICIAADESAHSDVDAQRRIDQGYRAMALKPVAKTLSMSLKVLHTAHCAGISCFCADLTVPPYLLEWNRNIAARIAPLPSMRCGVLESNGAQNYVNWSVIERAHSCPDGEWIAPKHGVFELDDEFYRLDGGLLQVSEYYRQLCGK